jgi:hypothetical protein
LCRIRVVALNLDKIVFENDFSVKFFLRFHERTKVLFPTFKLIVSLDVLFIVKSRHCQKSQKQRNYGLFVHWKRKEPNKKIISFAGYDPI